MLLESDSMYVVSDLNKNGPFWTRCGQLLLDTKILLSSLSHCLAKFALLQLLDKVWLEDCHSYYPKNCTCRASGRFMINEGSKFPKKKNETHFRQMS